MDILTLELFDVSISQGLVKLSETLEAHPGMHIRILLNREDENLLHNLQRFLGREGRRFEVRREGLECRVEVAPSEKVPPPAVEVLHPVQVISAAPSRPVLLLRSAFTPGEALLGRRLLLGVLQNLQPPVPWIALAHDALGLLSDQQAMEILREVQERGVRVRLSSDSLLLHDLDPGPFEIIQDIEWQSLLAKGAITLL